MGSGLVVEGARRGIKRCSEEKVIEALRTVLDPEIPLNIYDLGLIYRLTIEPANAVKVEMTLTAPGCPVAGDIVGEVKKKMEAIRRCRGWRWNWCGIRRGRGRG